VDLNRITILAGAFGVGIGIGLQNVVANFVAGLILVLERRIHVGDSVQLGDLQGQVREIGGRASPIRTWDGAEVIVPNSTLTSQQVTNWTLSDRLRRVVVPVGVTYTADRSGSWRSSGTSPLRTPRRWATPLHSRCAPDSATAGSTSSCVCGRPTSKTRNRS
jgi:Mechanosensitive ion channel, beta-domain